MTARLRRIAAQNMADLAAERNRLLKQLETPRGPENCLWRIADIEQQLKMYRQALSADRYEHMPT